MNGEPYWCIYCERAIEPEVHGEANLYVHDDVPHPEMLTFDEDRNPQ